MASAGELLRSERLKQGRSLADIADKTCISTRYLQAIEADSAEELPGEFFYKSFIRQYANALELDPNDTGRILAAAVPVSEPDPLPVLSQVYERAQTGERSRWRPSTAAAVGLLVAVLAGGSLTYAWWQRAQLAHEAAEISGQRQRNEPAAAENVPTPPPAQSSGSEAPAATPPAQQSAPAAAASARAPETRPPEPKASAPETPVITPALGQPVVEMSATEPAWIQVSSEGRTVFTGILEAGQSRQVPTAATATLRTGNAGGVEVRWNGKPVGSLGPKGQIRVVQFTPEGAEILTPKPQNVSAEKEPEP